MSSITLEPFSDRNLHEHIAVGQTVYATPEVLDADHLRWKHLCSPWGPSVSVSLRKPNQDLVGRSFIQPRPFTAADGSSLSGAIITDLVVAPEARNASALIAMTRAIKSPDGFGIVAHTSNETSDVIYRGLFKFPVAFNLTATGLPVRVSGALSSLNFGNKFTRRVLEGLAAPWRWLVSGAARVVSKTSGLTFGPHPTDDDLSGIISDFPLHAGQHFTRDRDFLNWRFETGPIFRADLHWLWQANRCLGYVALKRVSVRGLEVLVILDPVFRRPLSRHDAFALRLLCAELAVKSKADAIFSLANLESPALGWLGQFPYVRIPDKHLPHPTPIFIHRQGTSNASQPTHDVFFTLADLDYF